ncbi:hypothetical protein [Bradyrhizobium retamae]|uniref:hypothetical protein n=1 Tax=Bradyrhizobium retamae TaxID=1300035 RepID=UPI000A81D2AB|nr:hypothetical protein [Bradyrhizobium retamae]
MDFSFLNYLLNPATPDDEYRSQPFRLRVKKWRSADRRPFLIFDGNAAPIAASEVRLIRVELLPLFPA